MTRSPSINCSVKNRIYMPAMHMGMAVGFRGDRPFGEFLYRARPRRRRSHLCRLCDRRRPFRQHDQHRGSQGRIHSRPDPAGQGHQGKRGRFRRSDQPRRTVQFFVFPERAATGGALGHRLAHDQRDARMPLPSTKSIPLSTLLPGRPVVFRPPDSTPLKFSAVPAT